jgi:histone acetyltransferase
MRKFKSAWPFLEPVNREDVPDYYDIVTDPIGLDYLNSLIDIRSIEKKLLSNQY